ncbi:hypothetical protein EDD27_0725 [Nonomuraea polychroma]|uniref:Polyketide cyclase/dehydrase/lipid transport protein n=1 Tax=Nonomuraea polychroma TaxID=46176 RepID=A0A438LYU0_9ACTN|nr:hypothetical protein [Nonomuraea polychroma]RVX38418.1 hypothetical protein EDD27_0725 [Nonomuraea polychroma]
MFMARYMTRSMLRFAVGAAAGYVLAVRPWHLRWGAEDGEVYGEMAGDDIVRTPQYQATRAITVDAPPAAVWPWVVQVSGSPAQEGATTEQQGLKVGDTLRSGPDGAGFVVEQTDPPHTLVLVHRGEEAITTCSISLREIDDGRTRMVFRVRIKAVPGLSGTVYLARMDLADFLTVRRQMQTIKSRAESSR